MKRFYMTLMAGILALASLLATPSAKAQPIPFLDMMVSPQSQTGFPGDSLLWSVQLTNNSTDTAYFILTGFQDGLPVNPDVSVPGYDPTPFGIGYTLAPNGTLDLTNLFQTDIAPTATPNVYDATAEINYDLYDDNTYSNFLVDGITASGDWQVRVGDNTPAAVTPEPSSLALLTGPAVMGTLFYLRRRRTSRSSSV